MKCIILTAILMCMMSCFYEENTTTVAIIKNTTSHSISMLSFKNEAVLPGDTLQIMGGQEIFLANYDRRGIQGDGGFYSDFLNIDLCDSVVVIFDGRYHVSHYYNEPGQTAAKYIFRNSDRNILNRPAYQYTLKETGKHSIRQDYIYTFTEEDYQYSIN